MTEGEAVITQVKQGEYPSTWVVYKGDGSNCGTQLWAILAGALLLVIIVLFIIYPPSLPDGETYSGELVFLGIPCVICAIVALKRRRDAVASSTSILVLLPDGFVQCLAGDLNRISWLPYATAKNLEFIQQTEVRGGEAGTSTYHYYWLDAYGVDGKYYKYTISKVFGDQEFFCKTIIAAFNHYWSQN